MKLTTTRLQMPTLPRARFNLSLPIALTIIAFCSLAIVGMAARVRTTPPAPLPIIIIATPALPDMVVPTAAPAQAQTVAYAPTAAPPALVRWVTAFAAPDTSAVLGPIPEPAMSAITGRYGDSWVSTIHEGATVWVRISELGGNLANVAPAPPQPAVVYVAVSAPEAPRQAEQQYQVDNAPEQPAAPTQAPTVATDDYPRIVPATPASEAWRQEHCFGSGADEKCIP